MSKTNTRATINANIKTNGNQAITGAILNAGLNAIIDDYAEASELTNLESQVDAIKVEESAEITTTYDKDTESLTYKAGYYIPNSSGWASGAYNSWYFVADQDMKIYMAACSTSAAYRQIVTFTGGAVGRGTYTRVRNTNSNLPTIDSPMTIAEGTMVIVSTATAYTSWQLFVVTEGQGGYHLGTDIKVAYNQLTNVPTPKKPRIVKKGAEGASTTEALWVYYPMASGYLLYKFNHTISSGINADVWRIGNALKVDDNFANDDALTTSGEWECAIKISGRSDFSGGLAHGDEVYTDISFIIDGKVKTLSEITDLNFTEFRIIENSNLYDPADNTTIFATHASEHIFNADGLTINQSVEFTQAETISDAFLAMFPIAQSKVSKYYTDRNYKVFNLANNTLIRNASKVVVFDASSGVTAEFAVSKYLPYSNGQNALLISTNGGTSYYKCYYVIASSGSKSVAVGDLWQTTTTFKFL